MFKILGAIFGFLSLNFSVIGAVLGFFLGSSLDRAINLGVGAVNPFTGNERQDVFLEAVFSIMGKLAKADGRITQDEINHGEMIMSQMGIRGHHRQMAIDFYRAGAKVDFNIEPLLDKFLTVCGQTRNLRQTLLSYLITSALADGVLHDSEVELLRHIALRIGFSLSEFERVLRMVRAQSHFAGGQAPAKSALQDAYAALGVTEDQTDQQIKRAYRRLMSQNHPDKLIGQGLPKDMIKAATEQSQEIQAAYDLIMKNRKRH